MKFFKIFLWGLMISFLGSLPLGTLNIAAFQIGLESIANAIYFSFGSLFVEMIYVRISLVGINWVSKQVKLMRVMQWITFAIILALAIGSFISASQPHSNNQTQNEMLNLPIHPFILGLFMSAINPVQIPFWFGWSTVLFSKKILEPKNNQYNF